MLSPFSKILFAYLTLQYLIPTIHVLLTLIVSVTDMNQLLVCFAMMASVLWISPMTHIPKPLSLSLCVFVCLCVFVLQAHPPITLSTQLHLSCNFDPKSPILIIVFYLFYLNM